MMLMVINASAILWPLSNQLMLLQLAQVVVEKKLKRERQLTRHDLGREGFVAEVS